jgi:hypothetical protein
MATSREFIKDLAHVNNKVKTELHQVHLSKGDGFFCLQYKGSIKFDPNHLQYMYVTYDKKLILISSDTITFLLNTIKQAHDKQSF